MDEKTPKKQTLQVAYATIVRANRNGVEIHINQGYTRDGYGNPRPTLVLKDDDDLYELLHLYEVIGKALAHSAIDTQRAANNVLSQVSPSHLPEEASNGN